MKIAVIGARGQLGTDVCEIFAAKGEHVFPLDIDQVDIAEFQSVERVLMELAPEVVVNTAAVHHVEKCESEPGRAFAVNGIGSLNLSLVCNKLGAVLLHISTDYVFDGNKTMPYLETDTPQPLNVYAVTKLSGEHFVQATAEKHYIMRVSGIYGKNPCVAKGYNFVDLMLKLGRERGEVRVVDDEVLTPTFTEDIAAQIVKILDSSAEYGLYHATAEGYCSWYEFAAEIFRLAQPDTRLHRAAPGEFAVKVKRPDYSVLENDHLKRQKINIMPHWKDGLKRYIEIKTRP